MRSFKFFASAVCIVLSAGFSSATMAACLFSCQTSESTLGQPLILSGTLVLWFDEGAKCKQENPSDLAKCPASLLDALPQTSCNTATADPATACNAANVGLGGGLGTVDVSIGTVSNRLVYGQVLSEPKGNSAPTLVAQGCFSVQYTHNDATISCVPGDSSDPSDPPFNCTVEQFADANNLPNQLTGTVSRTLHSGTMADSCGFSDIIPGCEGVPDDTACILPWGGQVLKPSKVTTAFPALGPGHLAAGQTLLLSAADQKIESRGCTGHFGEAGVFCLESGKPHGNRTEADLVVECGGAWRSFDTQSPNLPLVNASGKNEQEYAILDAQDCKPADIDTSDLSKVTLNGTPATSCSPTGVSIGGGPLEDLVCTFLESAVADGTPGGTQECVDAGDDGAVINLEANAKMHLNGDLVALKSTAQAVCKFN